MWSRGDRLGPSTNVDVRYQRLLVMRALQPFIIGFLYNLQVVGAIWVAQMLLAASFWDGQSAYEQILGFTP